MPDTSTAQGRYYILDNGPMVDPARCGVCGYGGKERRYIDPRLDFDFYGTLIFCEECLASMARLFDFIEPAQALALEARVEEAERELISLRAAVAAVEAFRVAIGASTTNSVPVYEPDSSNVPDSVAVAPSADDAGTPESGAGSSDDIAESPSVEGRNDLRDFDTSNNSGIGLSL